MQEKCICLKDIKLSERVYDTLVKRSIVENRKLAEQYNEQIDCRDLYQMINIKFDDERNLIIKRISFPTLRTDKKQRYYDIYLIHIPYWRIGELPIINSYAMDLRKNHYASDSRTVFISGILYGHVEHRHIIRYKLRVFNIAEFGKEQWTILFKTMYNFLDYRCMKISQHGKIYGSMEKDIKRIGKLAEFFLDMSKINTPILSNNVISNVIRISNNGSNNILLERERRQKKPGII